MRDFLNYTRRKVAKCSNFRLFRESSTKVLTTEKIRGFGGEAGDEARLDRLPYLEVYFNREGTDHKRGAAVNDGGGSMCLITSVAVRRTE